MPLPANVTTVTVLGTFLTPEGDPSTGTVSFTPSSWLLNSGANIAIPNSSVVKTLGTAGDFTAVLPITDDPDLSPGGWVYSVSEVVDGVSQSYNIAIPGTVASGGTVFLADLVPVAPAGPEYYSLASSLAIGTVSTVATGGSATASITGLAPSQVLNLGIPTGATGPAVALGTVTPQALATATAGTSATAAREDHVHSSTVSNPTFTGVAQFPDGSAAAPSITNTGDTNTGIFHPADDTLAISTGGTERLRVDSVGRTVIKGTTAVSLVDPTSTTQADGHLRIEVNDTAGQNNLGGGISFSRVAGSTRRGALIAAVQTSSDADQTGLLFAVRQGSTTANDTLGEALRVTHNGFLFVGNGETAASPNNSRIYATGGSGTDVAGGSLGIYGGVSTGAGAGGAVSIFTSPAGASSSTANTSTERVKVDSNGLITGTGTSLGAWTAYTPTLSSGWAVGSDGSAAGRYCQIGKVVIFQAIITFGSTGSTFGAGALQVGLPISANAAALANFVVQLRDQSATSQYLGVTRIASATAVQIESIGTNGLQAAVTSTVPYTWAASDVVRVQGVYEAA